MLQHNSPVLPGTLLGELSEIKSADVLSIGTYAKGSAFFASLKGTFDQQKLQVISSNSSNTQKVPRVGDIVIGEVSRISHKAANVTIFATETDCFFPSTFKATLRQIDIRASEADKVKVYECFRPSDIICAEIIGEAEFPHGFILSTAKNDLGVLFAKSIQSNALMTPISWDSMQCPKSGTVEKRKCAKFVP